MRRSSAVTWSPKGNEDCRDYIHCPLCDWEMIYPKNDERKPALIFLDIDGVLIDAIHPPEVYSKIRETMKELFPYAQESFSGYQQNIATARCFKEEAVACLDKVIEGVEASGQRPLVVLSSSWRHACFLDQHRCDAYGQYKFSKYLCGKTSIDYRSEEMLSVESKLGFEFYEAAEKEYGIQLKDRASAIEFWLRDHGFDPNRANFVVIDDNQMEKLSKFGNRFVTTKWLMNESDADAAIEALTFTNEF
ncbi:HAD domain-containing protein [Candidatus Neptunochlamydia vexilliferae]|nr:HAD domain-containing protein [Candidatus Neptunochlamydia vexilliferae]